MSLEDGHVPISRKFWLGEWLEGRGITAWSCQEAWLDMIQMANFVDRPGQSRGEVQASSRFLATRWNWSRAKVRRQVQKWTSEGRIKVHFRCHTKVQEGRPTNRPTNRPTYLLVKYGVYNNQRPTNRPTNRPQSEEGYRSTTTTLLFSGEKKGSVSEVEGLADDAKGSVGKSVKLDARQRRVKEAEGWFEDLWKGWPARVTESGNRVKGGKKEARLKFLSAARQGKLPERSKVLWSMGRYRDHLRDSGERAMDLSRWVGKRRWDDWLEGEFGTGDGGGSTCTTTDYEALRRELGLTGDPVRRPETPYPFE